MKLHKRMPIATSPGPCGNAIPFLSHWLCHPQPHAACNFSGCLLIAGCLLWLSTHWLNLLIDWICVWESGVIKFVRDWIGVIAPLLHPSPTAMTQPFTTNLVFKEHLNKLRASRNLSRCFKTNEQWSDRFRSTQWITQLKLTSLKQVLDAVRK